MVHRTLISRDDATTNKQFLFGTVFFHQDERKEKDCNYTEEVYKFGILSAPLHPPRRQHSRANAAFSQFVVVVLHDGELQTPLSFSYSKRLVVIIPLFGIYY